MQGEVCVGCLILTGDFEIEVTQAADGGDGRGVSPPRDALLHPPFTCHLHRIWTSCEGRGAGGQHHMIISSVCLPQNHREREKDRNVV